MGYHVLYLDVKWSGGVAEGIDRVRLKPDTTNQAQAMSRVCRWWRPYWALGI